MLDDSKEGVEEASQSLKKHIECYGIYPKDVFLLYPIAYITLVDDWAENISLLNKVMDDDGYSFRCITHDRDNNIRAVYENLYVVY